MISELLNDPIVLKCVCECHCLLALDRFFERMQPLNEASATPLIVVCVFLRVHREQQESLAHADREDQRLVLLSRLVLTCRWRAWHPSENGGSAWTCSRGTHTDSTVKQNIVRSQISLRTLSGILITSSFFSRALEEREDREDQQEKLDQRWVTYFATIFLHMLL